VSAWRDVRIRDIATVFDGPHATPKSVKSATAGPVFLGISGLQNGRLDLAQSGHLSEEDFRQWTRRVTPQAGDVVFSYETRLGQAALIPDGLRCSLGRRLALIRVDRDMVDPRFLLFAYLGPTFQETIRQRTIHGSTVDRISLNDFPDFPIQLPGLNVQRGIATTLGALDDKIESNRRVLMLGLELLRRSVESVLLESKDQVPVAGLAQFVNGGAYTKNATGSARMVIRIAELSSGPGSSTIYNDISVPDDKVARPGDLLMAWSGSLGVHRWVLDEAIINQHIFKVIPDGYPAWLVFDALDRVMPVFRGIARDKATTMGHIQRGHLESTRVAVPTSGALQDLDAAMASLWGRMLVAEQESRRLGQLRDALLPELISGRIRVSEAREAVEDAVG
jgi:type I restriction enzyme S subunit